MSGLLRISALALAAAVAPAHAAPVTDVQVDEFVAALEAGDATALRAVIGERVVLFVGGRDPQRSSPEVLARELRGCRRAGVHRSAADEYVYVDFLCAGRPRAGLEEEEDPGYMTRLWDLPGGAGLAAAYYPDGIQVRPVTREIAPPAPPPNEDE
jgi:hypothetical protein